MYLEGKKNQLLKLVGLFWTLRKYVPGRDAIQKSTYE